MDTVSRMIKHFTQQIGLRDNKATEPNIPYLVNERFFASFISIRALDLELLGYQLSELCWHFHHLLVAFPTLGFDVEARFAFHVSIHALQNGREQESLTINTFQHVFDAFQVESDCGWTVENVWNRKVLNPNINRVIHSVSHTSRDTS